MLRAGQPIGWRNQRKALRRFLCQLVSLPGLALLLLGGPLWGQTHNAPYRWDASLAGFSTIQFILEQRPQYLPAAEAISHWSGVYGSHPLALVALMDLETAAKASPVAPLDDWLLQSYDPQPQLAARIRAVALALAKPEYATLQSQWRQLESDLEKSSPQSEPVTFNARFNALKRRAGLSNVPVDKGAAPELQMPLPYGQYWQFGGTHTNQGRDDGSPMSAIDLAANWYHVWGNDVSIFKVAAAHDGVASVLSSCFVLITHESGWMTGYYHLDNVQVRTGQNVRAGQELAEYADNIDQALCSGGHSRGPHQHFSLRFDGNHVALHQKLLGGYRVHSGDFDYDSHPERMYLEKNGIRHTAFSSLITNDVPFALPDIDHTYNGMWYQPSLSGHGLNLVIQSQDEGTALTVFVTFFSYDDQGLANFYAGNVTVSGWALNAPLTIPMLQTRNGGFTTPNQIDSGIDSSTAGNLILTLNDCQNGVLAFQLIERSSGQSVSNEYPIEKLLGAPGCQ